MEVLDYLVTSKVRRRLLLLLWAENKRGSVAELAELAGVAFASAHTELKAMQRVQFVSTSHEDGKEVFAANSAYPEAALLRALVADRPVAPVNAADELLKESLVALGAPLRGVRSREVPESEQMSVLVRGSALARRDAVVARCTPLCFWKRRATIDMKALGELAVTAEDKHTVGFFLELAGELGGDRRLGGLAETLRDGRMTAVRDFFMTSARREVFRDFPLAAKWGFRMNMDLEAFRSLFAKFVTR